MRNLTQEEAFEIAKKYICYAHQISADDFYLAEAEIDGDDWVLMVGYLTYFQDEDVGSEAGKDCEVTPGDVDSPSGHWQTQVVIEPDGSAYATADNNLDLNEHPKYCMNSEGVRMKKYTLKIDSNFFIDVIAATDSEALAEAKRLYKREHEITVHGVTEDLSLGRNALHRIPARIDRRNI